MASIVDQTKAKVAANLFAPGQDAPDVNVDCCESEIDLSFINNKVRFVFWSVLSSGCAFTDTCLHFRMH